MDLYRFVLILHDFEKSPSAIANKVVTYIKTSWEDLKRFETQNHHNELKTNYRWGDSSCALLMVAHPMEVCTVNVVAAASQG